MNTVHFTHQLMKSMKKLLYVSRDTELALAEELAYRIQMANLRWNPKDTCFLCVSPDYSSIITQLLSHWLTVDGEIFNIESVNVPFPDEPADGYIFEFRDRLLEWKWMWKHFVLIEAGVIRGGNYTWITNELKNIAPECGFTTLAMYENVHSNFHSDIVGRIYDNNSEDLHFWWERPNNHWKGV